MLFRSTCFAALRGAVAGAARSGACSQSAVADAAGPQCGAAHCVGRSERARAWEQQQRLTAPQWRMQPAVADAASPQWNPQPVQPAGAV